MLETVNIGKRYGKVWILKNINLKIQRGEILALLGGNGSGKTSLLNQFAKTSKASEGEIILDGRNTRESFAGKIGMVPHSSFLYFSLSIRENLDFYVSLFGVNKEVKERRINELSEIFEFFHYLDTPLRHLSEGLIKRVSIVRSIIHDPEIILMDEPFVSLDRKFADMLVSIMKEGFSFDCFERLPKERFFIFSPHFLERALEISSKIGVLNKGKLVALDEVGVLENNEIIKFVNG